ncbi:GFA family protein [Wenxinia marina]|uniref:CENP-V/GFA domain-containing protein n=1 Tax=Wenxinia marina DSM 24838 TaxID=1123501 RepID=A0A0D0QDI2_9RHOB|nr:GFA family protein [Wenxinia marina]KIQ70392.1 hypothetical protein Wenmar_00768 [Wenxinia marina DSM 24838]GGL53537.1 aldehyde-activating protein [Wenxinia marina]
MIRGSCLCGGVSFEVADPRPSVTFCHCSLCRAWSGHYWASTRAEAADVRFTADETLRWYASSDIAERGFCDRCGASLFFRPDGAGHIGIAAGALETPTGLTPGKHIFTADKGDYYDLPADAPHIPD